MKLRCKPFILIVFCLLISALWACSAAETVGDSSAKNPTEQTVDIPELPKIPEDYIYLAGEHVFLEYCPHRSRSAHMWLISASPLEETDLEGVYADGVSLDYVIGTTRGEQDPVMPFYVYQSFRGKDWKKLCDLEIEYKETVQKSLNITDITNALYEAQNEYRAEYEALREQNKLPSLYHYELTVLMPQDGFSTPEGVREITIRVNGKDLTFPLGEVRYRETDLQIPPAPGPLTPSRGSSWRMVPPSETGLFVESNGLNNNRFRAEENVVIKDICISEDTRELSDIQIIIISPSSNGPVYDENGDEINDIVADYLWDGTSPIALSAGQEIAINLTFHEPRLANTISGYTGYGIDLYYEHEDGTPDWTGSGFMVFIGAPWITPSEIYLQYELGVDVMSYYTDYYDILNTEEYGGITIIDSISGD